MNKKNTQNIMLIDGLRKNEYRIAIVNQQNGKLYDYDEVMEGQKVLKGNVYLAKITKVEPSLQAAFIDYGDQKSGFLPFSEIHPDYYQLPLETRNLLLSEREKLRYKMEATDSILPDNYLRINVTHNPKRKGTESYDRFNQYINDATVQDNTNNGVLRSDLRKDMKRNYISLYQRIENVTLDDRSVKAYYHFFHRMIHQNRFKIQEVVKSEQVILVQVIKDARGNKGVFLSTYISIPGRYCVLLPNSGKRISFSRKITKISERNKLKQIIEKAQIQEENMGVILRSSSATCRKKDLTQDLIHQLTLWHKIKERTVKSHAPCLIHKEDNHIKKVLREMYDDTIKTIIVQGDFAYNQTRLAVRQMMPSKLDVAKSYKGLCPLFVKYNIQNKVENIYNNTVTLPSGGYIVIQSTEAMVSIDVNSGKFTRERHVEETALNANLEAASEIALQTRLRDLSGLIVVDFIDMKYSKHNYEVENHLKDCLKTDRARVQVGHVDRSFGVLIFSRQRLKSSLHDSVTEFCNHCQGRGAVFTAKFCASLLVNDVNESLNRYVNAKHSCLEIMMKSSISHIIFNCYRDWLHQLSQYNNCEINFYCDNNVDDEKGYKINISQIENNRCPAKSNKSINGNLQTMSHVTNVDKAIDSYDAGENLGQSKNNNNPQNQSLPAKNVNKHRAVHKFNKKSHQRSDYRFKHKKIITKTQNT